MWTCIAVTCSDSSWANAITEELSILSSQGLLNCQLSCVVLKDTDETLRDGEETLNALLVTVEKLCKDKEFENVKLDVLTDSHILIIHHDKFTGNGACYWPNGTAFLPTQKKNRNKSGLETYLEFIINLCCQLKQGAPPGVWIVSSSCILSGCTKELFEWPLSAPDALTFTLGCQSQSAILGDAVQFRQPKEALNSLKSFPLEGPPEELEENMNSGIIYLKSTVATNLLCLSRKFPLDRCTYVGEDNGAKTLQVALDFVFRDMHKNLSLFYDLLGPLWIEDRHLYLSGDISSSQNSIDCSDNNGDKMEARMMLWEELHKFKLRSCFVDGLKYASWTALPLEEIFHHPHSIFRPTRDLPSILHSFAKQQKSSMLLINSSLESSINDNSELFMVSSSIKTSKTEQMLQLAGRAYVINAKVDIDEIPEFYLNDNVCMIGYWIRLENEVRLGRSLFSAMDIPVLEYSDSRATIFGQDWSNFFSLKGIEPKDIWTSDSGAHSLMTARLFPLALDVKSWSDLLWLQDIEGPSISRLESWRQSKRYSIEDFLRLSDPVAALHSLRSINCSIILKSISRWPGALAPYFRRACAENWSNSLFNALDEAVVEGDMRSCCRILAAIAELLACKACSESSLRSGPASNSAWKSAFDMLEHSLRDGVLALADQRVKWRCTPDLLLRAARHYERAVHILIRETVKSVENHMIRSCLVSKLCRPSIGEWIEAECPARLDLAGGWSDTPPICYEMGGSVVNIGILVDGEKPIGARGRRLEKLQLVLVCEGQTEPLVISSMDDVMNYSDPTTHGALLKAALVCAGVVQGDCRQDLSQQLEKTLGSGFELHGWSKLPQGSGLGTSSILASTLLAVIYSAMGREFNRSNLIHGVLYIEQLLTTGGGWQDQVGGVMGGCNRGHSFADSNVQVHIENIPLSERTVSLIDDRLLLIHTGKVRLARNLLQNVIRMWYARDEAIVDCFNRLVENADECKNAILQGNFDQLCHAVDVYWCQKKAIAPGCEPLMVKNLMGALSHLVHGQSLAGAGGGGFYYGFLKRPEYRDTVEKIVTSVEGCETMIIHRATVDQTGISLKVDRMEVNIS